ncbi:hypothetical protein RJT34_09614 [Clitoria ternatea]|uniref:Uncharacterized protein n=1 Tax=Clitoria ternatea TaxID=43366 RepID=A0AAN9K745_CLITE
MRDLNSDAAPSLQNSAKHYSAIFFSGELKRTNHVDKFTNLMVSDDKTDTCYRVDHLLKDFCNEKLQRDLTFSSDKATELKHELIGGGFGGEGSGAIGRSIKLKVEESYFLEEKNLLLKSIFRGSKPYLLAP